jgi:F-type H+-transporting ATPase subunit b
MNINLTLIGQSITFAFFVWFTMKFVWPPIMTALHERKKKIADGLAAGEKGKHELGLAQQHAVDVIKEAKNKASEIINLAERRAGEIADEAKVNAKQEADRIVASAQSEIEQETNRAREALRAQMSSLVVSAASKVLSKEIDAAKHAELLEGVAKEL